MPNLLPEYSKKKIRVEYRLRIASIILVFTLTALLIGLAFLIPTYVLLKVEHDDRTKIKEEMISTIKATQGEDYITALGDITNKISVLRQERDDTTLIAMVTKITNQMVPGVKLESIDYTTTGGSNSLVLTGHATTRDALINFKNSLQNEKSFTEIKHSIADLIKAENLDFTLSIKGNF